MKTTIYFLLLAVTISSCAYRQIGELNSVSSRNYESKIEYKLIQKYVDGKAKTKNGHGLENAIDDAVKKYPDGENMRNVKVFIKSNGNKIKVVGDVWGNPSVNAQITKSATANIKFQTGDIIMFVDTHGKIVDGKIIALNTNTAIVQYYKEINWLFGAFVYGTKKKIELSYEKLSK